MGVLNMIGYIWTLFIKAGRQWQMSKTSDKSVHTQSTVRMSVAYKKKIHVQTVTNFVKRGWNCYKRCHSVPSMWSVGHTCDNVAE